MRQKKFVTDCAYWKTSQDPPAGKKQF